MGAAFPGGYAVGPFGRARVRRVERELITDYLAVIGEIVDTLDRERFDRALHVVGLSDLVRGYQDVKMGNVERYREELASALELHRRRGR